MNKEQAKTLLLQTIKDRKAWGRHAELRCHQNELIDALMLFEGELSNEVYTKDDITKLNRQIAAANARVAGLTKKGDNKNDA